MAVNEDKKERKKKEKKKERKKKKKERKKIRDERKKEYLNENKTGWFGWLFGFYGISTFVG